MDTEYITLISAAATLENFPVQLTQTGPDIEIIPINSIVNCIFKLHGAEVTSGKLTTANIIPGAGKIFVQKTAEKVYVLSGGEIELLARAGGVQVTAYFPNKKGAVSWATSSRIVFAPKEVRFGDFDGNDLIARIAVAGAALSPPEKVNSGIDIAIGGQIRIIDMLKAGSLTITGDQVSKKWRWEFDGLLSNKSTLDHNKEQTRFYIEKNQIITASIRTNASQIESPSIGINGNRIGFIRDYSLMEVRGVGGPGSEDKFLEMAISNIAIMGNILVAASNAAIKTEAVKYVPLFGSLKDLRSKNLVYLNVHNVAAVACLGEQSVDLADSKKKFREMFADTAFIFDVGILKTPFENWKIKPDEMWLRLASEVTNLYFFERHGGPAQLYSDSIVFCHPRTNDQIDKTKTACIATDRAIPLAFHRLGAANQPVSTISYGDVHLELDVSREDKVPPIQFASLNWHNVEGGEWKFRVASAIKTPFRGDAQPKLASTPVPTDRLERYSLNKTENDYLVFNSFGEFTNNKNGDDPLSLFSIMNPLQIEGIQQPENSKFVFRPGTSIKRNTKQLTQKQVIKLIRNGQRVTHETVYTNISADVKFANVLSNVDSHLAQQDGSLMPSIGLEYKVGKNNEALRNEAIRKGYYGQEVTDLCNMKEGNQLRTYLPIGFSFGLDAWQKDEANINEANINKQCLVLSLEKNAENVSDIPKMLNLDWKEGSFSFTDNTKFGKGIKLQEDWWPAFSLQKYPGKENVKQTHYDRTSPAKNGWVGACLSGLQITADEKLPTSIRQLVGLIAIDLGWFGGTGPTMLTNYVGPDPTNSTGGPEDKDKLFVVSTKTGELSADIWTWEKIKADLITKGISFIILQSMDLIMVAGQIVKLSMRLLWRFPMLDGEDKEKVRFLEIGGSFKASTSGKKEFILEAKLPENPLSIGFAGIKEILITKLGFQGSAQKLEANNEKTVWSLVLDGEVRFIKDNSLVKEWLGDLEFLSFSGWEMPFEGGDFKFPALKLNNQGTRRFFDGFDFKLKGFQFTKSLPTSDKINGINLLGGINFAFPAIGIEGLDIELPVQLTFAPFDIKFGTLTLTGVKLSVFKMFVLELSDITWDKTEKNLGGNGKLSWSGGNNYIDVRYKFAVDKASNTSYWAVAVSVGSEKSLEIGPITVKKPALLISHFAWNESLPKLSDPDNDGKLYEQIGKSKLAQWAYKPDYNYVIGIAAEEIQIGETFFSGEKFLLLVCDDDAARISADKLTVSGFPLAKVVIAIDWRKPYFFAQFTPTGLNLSYGAYEFRMGTVAIGVGREEARFSLGYDGDPVVIKWEPMPGPIPLNKIFGGFGVWFRSGSSAGLGIGVRIGAGYEKTVGSDGGLFGAYLKGGYSIAVNAVAIVGKVNNELVFINKGALILDGDARGGVVVIGCRFDILSATVHGYAAYACIIRSNSMSTAWGFGIQASFSIRISPCTSVGGTLTFKQGMSEAQATDYTLPARALLISDANDPNEAAKLAFLEQFRRNDIPQEKLVSPVN